MGVVGHQLFLAPGARVKFKRDTDSAGVQYAQVDMGIIESFTAQVTPSKIVVEDTDGGIRRTVEEMITKIDEVWNVRTKNISPRNISYLMLGKLPESFVQAQAEKTVTHRAWPGELILTHDSDTPKTRLFKLDAFGGIYTGTVLTKALESIDKATKTLKLTGDQTAVAGLAPGKSIIVNRLGLTNVKNSNSYTIVTRTLNAGKTDLVVEQEPDSSEAGLTSTVTHENAGSIYKRDVDWALVSLIRGEVRLIAGGAISTEQDVICIFTVAAISGDRLIKPLTLQGALIGTMEIWMGSQNNDQQFVRQARVSITPGNPEFTLDDASVLTFDLTVLSDITNTALPSGRIVHVTGSQPSKS